VELIIQRYTREAGVRNLGRHLAALARAAAVKVAEKQQSDRRHTREMEPTQASHMIDHGGGDLLLEGTEVEMEVKALGVRETLTKPEPMVVDEAVLELVLGVGLSLSCVLPFRVMSA
jgi:ATP-dependent Lon protease